MLTQKDLTKLYKTQVDQTDHEFNGEVDDVMLYNGNCKIDIAGLAPKGQEVSKKGLEEYYSELVERIFVSEYKRQYKVVYIETESVSLGRKRKYGQPFNVRVVMVIENPQKEKLRALKDNFITDPNVQDFNQIVSLGEALNVDIKTEMVQELTEQSRKLSWELLPSSIGQLESLYKVMKDLNLLGGSVFDLTSEDFDYAWRNWKKDPVSVKRLAYLVMAIKDKTTQYDFYDSGLEIVDRLAEQVLGVDLSNTATQGTSYVIDVSYLGGREAVIQYADEVYEELVKVERLFRGKLSPPIVVEISVEPSFKYEGHLLVDTSIFM